MAETNLTPAEHLLTIASYLLGELQECVEGHRVAQYMLDHAEGAAALFQESPSFQIFRLELTMLIEMHEVDKSLSTQLALAGPREDDYTIYVMNQAWEYCHFDLIPKMVRRLQVPKEQKAIELAYWRAKISIEKSNWRVVKRQLKQLQKLSLEKHDRLLREVQNSRWGNVLSDKGLI
jgi:hypothetical protein